jgi:hypothetical protein
MPMCTGTKMDDIGNRRNHLRDSVRDRVYLECVESADDVLQQSFCCSVIRNAFAVRSHIPQSRLVASM